MSLDFDGAYKSTMYASAEKKKGATIHFSTSNKDS